METTAVIAIVSLCVLATGLAVGILFIFKRYSDARSQLARTEFELEQGNRTLARVEEENQELEARIDALRNECSALQAKVADLLARNEEMVKAHEEARKKLEESFKSLSADALKASSEQFLHLAKKSFESEQNKAQAELEKRKQAIEHLVKPVRETLETYHKSVSDIEKSRKEAYGSLNKQLEMMSRDQQVLRDETAKLVNALKRPEVRGRWGEMQLRRVAELAGMIEHCDFVEQETTVVDGRSFRPDMVVLLPSERRIVVDAKTPLDAYLRSLEAENSDERANCLVDYTRQIEERIAQLASKDYAAQFQNSPDFVVLFIPGESFLQAAVQLKPRMVETAMERGVVIATPSTLISLLRVIAMGWREQRLAEDAQRIAEAGRELHRRLTTAMGHLESLRKSLEGTVKHFNRMVGSVEHSVLPQARRFEDLNATGGTKGLPDSLPEIDVRPRHVDAPALLDDASAGDSP